MNQMNNECLICSIVKGKTPSKKVYEDQDFIAFHDINPRAEIHVLVVPKKHIESMIQLSESDKDLMGKLVITVKKVAEELGITDGYNVVINNGKNAGQQIPHMHWHLLYSWNHKEVF